MFFLQLADIISCVEFNQDGDLLATGDKGGRVVIFQRDPASKKANPRFQHMMLTLYALQVHTMFIIRAKTYGDFH